MSARRPKRQCLFHTPWYGAECLFPAREAIQAATNPPLVATNFAISANFAKPAALMVRSIDPVGNDYCMHHAGSITRWSDESTIVANQPLDMLTTAVMVRPIIAARSAATCSSSRSLARSSISRSISASLFFVGRLSEQFSIAIDVKSQIRAHVLPSLPLRLQPQLYRLRRIN